MVSRSSSSRSTHSMPGKKGTAYLGLNMPKVNSEFLQQRRLAIVSLGRERSKPAGLQAGRLAHPTRHARAADAAASEAAKRRGRPSSASDAIAAADSVAGRLRRRRVPRHGRRARGGVGRRVELQVLRRLRRRPVRLVVRPAVVVGHRG